MSGRPSADDRARLADYDAVVVNSRYTAAHFESALRDLQLPQMAIRVLNPPVQQIGGGCASKKRNILTVGRFFVGGHAKRHDVLISAFKSMCRHLDEPVEFHIAGSSTPSQKHMDYLASLKASAAGYPVKFYVNCPAQELLELYRDAFVYWHGTGIGVNLSMHPEKAEHFGISIVEAMSAQAIPFALNAGGPKEIITDSENGFLFDSPETLIRSTLNIFSKTSRPYAERIMRAAGQRAGDFSIENFAREVEALVEELT